ncbi:MAG: PAM68 family protein [Cyanobacteriota bacterium]|nr:PAM68 family protein [Cyanobacteriota bacterium]
MPARQSGDKRKKAPRGKLRPSSTQANASPSQSTPRSSPSSLPAEERSNYIPPEVSQRMIRRVVWFCGIPTLLGVSSFGVNYYLLVNHIVTLPPAFTFVETLALFGLGFVGISYGVLSASWDPQPGSRLGWSEFRQNLGLTINQWLQPRGSVSHQPDPTDSTSTGDSEP